MTRRAKAEAAAKPTLRVAASPCKRCLFGADPLVSADRKAELISASLKADTFFTCHVPQLRAMESGAEEDVPSVCCRVFYERYKADSLALRLATMFGFVKFVDVEAGRKDDLHG